VTTPYGYKPRANVLTQVCHPTPIVRFMPISEPGSNINSCTAWHDFSTREHFYRWPYESLPPETLLRLKRAKELHTV
jgi:hypothetical protein